jgi:hypothetical protein
MELLKALRHQLRPAPYTRAVIASLAHGVRAAFGMTPINDPTSREHTLSPPRQQKYDSGLTSPGARLPPMGTQQTVGYLPSLSRGGSPSTAAAGSGHGGEGAMEVDAQT